jgi:hypothetical protein
MAFDQLGLSFLPRGGAAEDSSGPSGGARLEDVLRVLSFRLPRVLGARPIAPAELLNSPGAAGNSIGGAIAQAIVANMRRGMPGGMPDMGAPSQLGSLFGGQLGPNPQPNQLPSPPVPKIHAQEPPADQPARPTGGNIFNDTMRDMRSKMERTKFDQRDRSRDFTF